MIRFIHGILREAEDGLVVVEASGVGYGIRVPQSVLEELPAIGEEVQIYTYFSIRQDAMELFGFLAPEDRKMFVQLLSVNGVGPKGALAVLSALKPDMLRMAIVTGDAKSIARAPGVGLKTAQRVILDLKDKLNPEEVLHNTFMQETGQNAGTAGLHSEAREAAEALVALGYTNIEATRAVRKVEIREGMTSDEVLKQSLRHLSFI